MKESAFGCAGIFNAPVALEVYTQVFEEEGALERLEVFASEHGPRFYGLAPNAGRVALTRTPWQVPDEIELVRQAVVPFLAGERLTWQLERHQAVLG